MGIDLHTINKDYHSITSHQGGAWEVELGATTLAALETINAVQSGAWEVSLDAATLAALETVTTVEGGYGSWKTTAESVGTTESELVATPLANRVAVLIENLSGNDLYIKDATGVTTGNGLKIPRGTSVSLKLTAAANIFGIMNNGTSQDIRVTEFAA